MLAGSIGALGQRMEKVLKAHVDAMWARVAEENAKREKSEKERVQQVNTLLSNLVSKDMPNALERGFKKEFVALGPTITQAVLPPLQKAISTVVMETFQVRSSCISNHISFCCLQIGFHPQFTWFILPMEDVINCGGI